MPYITCSKSANTDSTAELTAFRSTFSSFFLAGSCDLAVAAAGVDVEVPGLPGVEVDELVTVVDGVFTEAWVAVLVCCPAAGNSTQNQLLAMYSL